MLDGTYKFDLEMRTPLGKRHGTLELTAWNNLLNGYLTMFTRTTPIIGKCEENNITFEGSMITLMNTLTYQAEGIVTASGLDMMIVTKQGKYPVTGNKRSA